MELLKLMVEYWSQVTVILFSFGYILKVILDSYFKQREVKFNFIHKERAEVIKQLHSDLWEMSEAIQHLALDNLGVDYEPSGKKRRELINKVSELNNAIRNTIGKNQIYFSDGFISNFNVLYDRIIKDIILNSINQTVIDNQPERDSTYQDQFFNYYVKEFPYLQDRLQKEFRRYL